MADESLPAHLLPSRRDDNLCRFRLADGEWCTLQSRADSIYCVRHAKPKVAERRVNPYALTSGPEDAQDVLLRAITRAHDNDAELVSLRGEIEAGQAVTRMILREVGVTLGLRTHDDEDQPDLAVIRARLDALKSAQDSIEAQSKLKERYAKVLSLTNSMVLPGQVEDLMRRVVRVVERVMADDPSMHGAMSEIFDSLDAIPLPKRSTTVRLKVV